MIKLKVVHLLITALVFSSIKLRSQSSEPELWNDLLGRHVAQNGKVNYQGFITDKEKLQRYLDWLSQNPPKDIDKVDEQLAYWINAYNAFTIKLIIDNYPLQSITDLNPKVPVPGLSTVWDKRFFEIGGKEFNLNEIEHEILRKKFNEPRIHFAIVCASFSCPNLRNEAFTASRLDEQLQDQAIRFINDPTKNLIEKDRIEISMIFQWFSTDFTKNGDLIDFINQFSKTKINSRARVKFRAYDWSLNE